MRFKLMASLLSLLAMPAFAQESRDWSLGALQKTEFTEAAAGDSASFSVTWEKQYKRVKSGRGVIWISSIISFRPIVSSRETR